MSINHVRKSVPVAITACILLLGCPIKAAENATDTLDELLMNFELRKDSDTTFGRLFNSGRYERALSEALSGDVNDDPKKFFDVLLCQFLLGKYKDGVVTSKKWLTANQSAPVFNRLFLKAPDPLMLLRLSSLMSVTQPSTMYQFSDDDTKFYGNPSSWAGDTVHDDFKFVQTISLESY